MSHVIEANLEVSLEPEEIKLISLHFTHITTLLLKVSHRDSFHLIKDLAPLLLSDHDTNITF